MLPKLLLTHRGNYEAAGSRVVKIIDEGSYKKRDEIGEYFKRALSVQAAPTRHARVKRHAQKSALQVEPEKTEYRPEMRVPPKFSSITSQDKLAEGLLRTGIYIFNYLFEKLVPIQMYLNINFFFKHEY